MSAIIYDISLFILVVVTYGHTENVRPRSRGIGEDSESLESGTPEEHGPFASQVNDQTSVFAHFWKNEPRETHASSTSDKGTDFRLNVTSSNAVKDEEEKLQLIRRRRNTNDSSSYQMTRFAIAMKTLEIENTQLKSTVKELQSATKNFETREQASNFAVSQVNAALQQQQLAIGQLQLQVSQLSTSTMKLQDENEALRAQIRLRMKNTDSGNEQMQTTMLMISNLTTKLQAENSSLYSQLLEISDLTSGLQAENSSIYTQLLRVSDLLSGLQAENSSIYTQLLRFSDLTSELQAENSSIYSQLLKVSDMTSGLQANGSSFYTQLLDVSDLMSKLQLENSSIYTQLVNVYDLMAGLQSENSSIYSQLQALSTDVIQRRKQYEDQHTALQEKVRMLQTQTTSLDSHLSKRNSALEERLMSQVTQLQQKDQELVQMVIKRTSEDLIGFHARLSRNVDGATTGTLVLDKVEYNAGGGYDSTTGIFTAPVTGLYLFLATIAAVGTNTVARIHIEVNGNPRAGCYSGLENDVELATCHGAHRMLKGQQIRIVNEGSSSRQIWGGYWTTFTVVLIQRDP